MGVKALVESLNKTVWQSIRMEEHASTRRVEEAKIMLHWLCLSQHLPADAKLRHAEILSEELGQSLPSKICLMLSGDSVRDTLRRYSMLPAAWVKLCSNAMCSYARLQSDNLV